MNNEYWKSLIEAGVPIVPVIPGEKRPIGTWRDLSSRDEWLKYKEIWLIWAEGPAAVAKADGITEAELAERLGVPGEGRQIG